VLLTLAAPRRAWSVWCGVPIDDRAHPVATLYVLHDDSLTPFEAMQLDPITWKPW